VRRTLYLLRELTAPGFQASDAAPSSDPGPTDTSGGRTSRRPRPTRAWPSLRWAGSATVLPSERLDGVGELFPCGLRHGAVRCAWQGPDGVDAGGGRSPSARAFHVTWGAPERLPAGEHAHDGGLFYVSNFDDL